MNDCCFPFEAVLLMRIVQKTNFATKLQAPVNPFSAQTKLLQMTWDTWICPLELRQVTKQYTAVEKVLSFTKQVLEANSLA